ncbi:MAG: cadherin-like domain-containing protein [Gammaproteobacteria bacterium]|nr:cadherin-like domain-containing protein [Gammaproteobacteria bacterium]MDH5802116.1 cadherin-like domain-containing protein [Gammaproteobacteria bacterium]
MVIKFHHVVFLSFILIFLHGCSETEPGPGAGKSQILPQAELVSISESTRNYFLSGDRLQGTYVYSDSSGRGEGQTLYRWLRNGEAITGQQYYFLTAADNNTELTFEVTPVADDGVPGEARSASQYIQFNNRLPQAQKVFIRDNNYDSALSCNCISVGDILSGRFEYFDTEGDLQGGAVYQWTRGGVSIPNATGANYLVTEDDRGAVIGFKVRPVTADGAMGNVANATVVEGNHHPTATNDTRAINANQPDLALTDLQNNDIDLDGDTLVVAEVGSNNTVATVELVSNNRGVSYLMRNRFGYLIPGEVEVDTFQYKVSDNRGGYAWGTVTITITGVNDIPIATADAVTVNAQDVDVAISVLDNDSDADAGDSFTITGLDLTSLNTTGSARVAGNNILYTPQVAAPATDSFIYEITDSYGGVAAAQVDVTIQ